MLIISPVIIHYRKIIHIPLFRNFAFFISRTYTATRFIFMYTVIELAVLQGLPHFYIIVRNFLGVKIHNAEFADARRINHTSPEIQLMHFGKGGGVHALAGYLRNVLCS